MTVLIILNYKNAPLTIRLVRSLLDAGLGDGRRIVVVDNCSPDGSFAQLREALGTEPIVDVIESGENGGYAKGNNIGLRHAAQYNPDFACVINNDVLFDPQVLSQLETLYRSLPDAGAIAPVQLRPDGNRERFETLRCRGFWQELCRYSVIHSKLSKDRSWNYVEDPDHKGVQCVDIVPGSFIFIDYRLFEKAGWFDEATFLFWEEHFLYKKMQELGRRNYIALELSYVHDHSKTINDEYGFIAQSKLLTQGFRLFTSRFERHAAMKCALIDLCSWISITRYRLYVRLLRRK